VVRLTDTSQDYLAHYFDIALYNWLFALSIGVFLALFLLRRPDPIAAL
jgi:hypothetical protein